jgi:hypothetical protein
LFGVLSTLVALILDIHVQRGATQRGKFTSIQQIDEKGHPEISAPIQHGGYESNPNPSARGQQRDISTDRGRYAVPQEQFAYGDDAEVDIGYHGAGGEIRRRSFEDRT